MQDDGISSYMKLVKLLWKIQKNSIDGAVNNLIILMNYESSVLILIFWKYFFPLLVQNTFNNYFTNCKYYYVICHKIIKNILKLFDRHLQYWFLKLTQISQFLCYPSQARALSRNWKLFFKGRVNSGLVLLSNYPICELVSIDK